MASPSFPNALFGGERHNQKLQVFQTGLKKGWKILYNQNTREFQAIKRGSAEEKTAKQDSLCIAAPDLIYRKIMKLVNNKETLPATSLNQLSKDLNGKIKRFESYTKGIWVILNWFMELFHCTKRIAHIEQSLHMMKQFDALLNQKLAVYKKTVEMTPEVVVKDSNTVEDKHIVGKHANVKPADFKVYPEGHFFIQNTGFRKYNVYLNIPSEKGPLTIIEHKNISYSQLTKQISLEVKQQYLSHHLESIHFQCVEKQSLLNQPLQYKIMNDSVLLSYKGLSPTAGFHKHLINLLDSNYPKLKEQAQAFVEKMLEVEKVKEELNTHYPANFINKSQELEPSFFNETNASRVFVQLPNTFKSDLKIKLTYKDTDGVIKTKFVELSQLTNEVASIEKKLVHANKFLPLLEKNKHNLVFLADNLEVTPQLFKPAEKMLCKWSPDGKAMLLYTLLPVVFDDPMQKLATVEEHKISLEGATQEEIQEILNKHQDNVFKKTTKFNEELKNLITKLDPRCKVLYHNQVPNIDDFSNCKDSFYFIFNENMLNADCVPVFYYDRAKNQIYSKEIPFKPLSHPFANFRNELISNGSLFKNQKENIKKELIKEFKNKVLPSLPGGAIQPLIKGFTNPKTEAFVHSHIYLDLNLKNELIIYYIDQETNNIAEKRIPFKDHFSITNAVEQVKNFRKELEWSFATNLAIISSDPSISSMIVREPITQSSTKERDDLKETLGFKLFIDKKNPGKPAKLFFYMPLTGMFSILEVQGVTLQAVHKTIARAKGMRKFQELMKEIVSSDKKALPFLGTGTPGVSDWEAQPATDKRPAQATKPDDFIFFKQNKDASGAYVFYKDPTNPNQIARLVVQSLDELKDKIAEARQTVHEVKAHPFTKEFLAKTAVGASQIPPAPPVDTKKLVKMFDAIEWGTDLQKQQISKDITLLNGAKGTPEDLKKGIKRMRTMIKSKTKYDGVPNAELKREIWYANLDNVLKHVTHHALELMEVSPGVYKHDGKAADQLVEIGKAGLECGTRWKSATAQAYGILTGEYGYYDEDQEETIDCKNEFLKWSDKLKLGTIEEMVMEGNNSQNSHEYVLYTKTVNENGIAVPLAEASDYDDVYGANGLHGVYKNKTAILAAFRSKYNVSKVISTFLEKCNKKWGAGEKGTSTLTLKKLRKAVLKQYLHKPEYWGEKQGINQAIEKFETIKTSLLKDGCTKEQLTVTDQQKYESAQNMKICTISEICDTILEKENLILVEDDLPTGITRAGVITLMKYFKWIKP